MFIAIDVGNTNITIGVREDEEWTEHRIDSKELRSTDYYKQQLAQIVDSPIKNLTGVGISSVVPNLTGIILDAVKVEMHPEPILLHKKWYHLLP